MDTELLHAFVTVAQQESFSSAADTLGLSQPAVSKRIAQLENRLAQALFDRIGREIKLTEAGRTLLPRAQHILQALSDTQQLMMDFNQVVAGPLRIATSHHIGLHRLPQVLKRFTRAYPQVHLDLHFIDSEQAIRAILQGEFDLALITLPASILKDEMTSIQHTIVWQDPMAFVVNKAHPLAKKNRVSLHDLGEFPAILPDRNTYTTQLIQALFDNKQQTLNISMTTNHLDAIKMMISVGLGWSVLPETLTKSGLKTLPVHSLKLQRQLGCVYHRERTISNAARAMINTLKKDYNERGSITTSGAD